ncbi:hypothetical protein LSAT2_031021, partial [Lamellibrachia satsuma]
MGPRPVSVHGSYQHLARWDHTLFPSMDSMNIWPDGTTPCFRPWVLSTPGPMGPHPVSVHGS